MPNWPVTTTTITEGTIIKASDLENNFNVLKNAANTLHERFSTLSLSCMINVEHDSFTTGSTAGIAKTLGVYENASPYGHLTDDDGYTVFGVFQVPSFCQAIRVRTLDVLNSSIMGKAATGTLTITDNATPLEVGARYVSAISGWDQNASSAPGSAIGSVTFPVSGDYAKGLTTSYTTLPTVKQATPSTLVLGGQYIMVYGRGGLDYAADSGVVVSNVHYRFHVNMMCDAMVPIP